MRFARLTDRAWRWGVDEFPFLTSIDRYGDTTLNYLMAERLGSELARALPLAPEDADVIATLAEACHEVANGRAEGLRLVFLGD